jgi:uncharacterized membrane protein YhhN
VIAKGRAGTVATARRALIEQRPWLLAGVLAALAFYFLWNNPIGGLWLILIKGAAVGSLAVYVWRWSVGNDGTILAIALALSSAGDMALELWFEVGGTLFVLSHLVAITLYARNIAERVAWGDRVIALVLLIAAPLVSFILSERLDIAAYASVLGAMACAAWLSRFPTHRVGLGAVLFVLSDWLIFSRFGPYDLAPLPDMLIWPLYFAGQLMIATGVVQVLRGETPAP